VNPKKFLIRFVQAGNFAWNLPIKTCFGFSLFTSDTISNTRRRIFKEKLYHWFRIREIKIVAITAFRNSAKSTLCALVFAIWSVLGSLKKKHVVIVCQTQTRSKETLANLRAELERMGILVEDYHPQGRKIRKVE
jgi:hypothetical protein